jgi:hypothetical protein
MEQHSHFLDARGQGAWITSTSVETDKTKESLAEMNRELRDIVGGHPVTGQELTVAKAGAQVGWRGSRWISGAGHTTYDQHVSHGLVSACREAGRGVRACNLQSCLAYLPASPAGHSAKRSRSARDNRL